MVLVLIINRSSFKMLHSVDIYAYKLTALDES